MTMIEAVRHVLGNYVNFDGRAARSEYWWWTLAAVITFIVVGIIEGIVVAPMLGFEPYATEAGRPISMLLGLGIFLPGLAVTVRRLHDTDRVGWWVLLQLIPIVGPLVLLYFLVCAGDAGPNRFGDSPVPIEEDFI